MSKELIKISTNEQGKKLVSARELHKGLKIKTPFHKWMPRMIEYGFEENIDFRVEDILLYNPKGGSQKGRDYIITLDMAKDLCRKQRRNVKAGEVLNYLLSIDCKEIMVIEPKRKELEFLDMLEKALEPFNYTLIRQYNVLNYRVDLYIKELNATIEFDENNHDSYRYEQHEGRQREIEKELGCKFIRVSDNESNLYNIGLVMKGLMEVM